MGGVLAKLDQNKKIITMRDERNPNLDYSKIINLYNNNGFTKFNIDINSLKTYLKNLWDKTNFESIDISGQVDPFGPTGQITRNNYILTQLKQILQEPNTVNANRSKLGMIGIPLILGTNTGLYTMLEEISTSFTILIPNIIFSKDYNNYFNTYLDSITNKTNKSADIENNKMLIQLISSINQKTNYSILNNKIRLLNTLNLLFKLAILSQLIGYMNNATVKQNIINIFIDEVTNIINMIPSDKCYLESGIITTEPNICIPVSGPVTGPTSGSTTGPTSGSTTGSTTGPSPVQTTTTTTTTKYSSSVNPFYISYMCSCCCCIIFIFMMIKLLSPASTPLVKEE